MRATVGGRDGDDPLGVGGSDGTPPMPGVTNLCAAALLGVLRRGVGLEGHLRRRSRGTEGCRGGVSLALTQL
ncbi:MAG: hypothetical protein M3Q76_04830 [Acidobacteriota bacterium]|nr:hypothetical protein [Acidobacteriota bacterium]